MLVGRICTYATIKIYAPFLPYFDTLKTVYFTEVPGGPKIFFKKFKDIQKLFQVGFVKRFVDKNKKKSNYFCNGCPKSGRVQTKS